MNKSASSWGSQSWLQAGFSAGLDALESASAGRIARPTNDTHPKLWSELVPEVGVEPTCPVKGAGF